MAGQGGGQKGLGGEQAGRRSAAAEADCRSLADSQGLTISSGEVAANARPAIRSSDRPDGARGILRGRAR